MTVSSIYGKLPESFTGIKREFDDLEEDIEDEDEPI